MIIVHSKVTETMRLEIAAAAPRIMYPRSVTSQLTARLTTILHIAFGGNFKPKRIYMYIFRIRMCSSQPKRVNDCSTLHKHTHTHTGHEPPQRLVIDETDCAHSAQRAYRNARKVHWTSARVYELLSLSLSLMGSINASEGEFFFLAIRGACQCNGKIMKAKRRDPRDSFVSARECAFIFFVRSEKRGRGAVNDNGSIAQRC